MFIAVLGVGFLAMTILQLDSIIKYNSLEITSMCWQVWSNVLTSALFNMLSCVIVIISGATIYSGNHNENGNVILLYGLIPKFIVNIWSCVIYFSIDTVCLNKYEEIAPKLITFLNAEVFMSLVIYCAIGLLLCFYTTNFLGVRCISCRESRTKDKENYTRIDGFDSL